MKRFDQALVLIASAAAMSPAFAAQGTMPGMGSMGAAAMGGKPAVASMAHGFMAYGTINSVNASAGTINITHHAIQALHWPGMTMNFPVQDKRALASLKPGEKVDFDLERVPSGQYAISKVRAAR